jgi:hypothetical protein
MHYYTGEAQSYGDVLEKPTLRDDIIENNLIRDDKDRGIFVSSGH